MTIDVKTQSPDSFVHSIQINDHQLFTDLPEGLGGHDEAPSPHDYFDAALGACKALTLKLYAQRKGIPLTGVHVQVNRDNAAESTGKYVLNVTLRLEGDLTHVQRKELDRIADHCPVHKLMTTAEVSIETTLVDGQ
ncbi:OsmC family protein [Pseudomonas sp. HR96]|uniref:OsmC family protein n=1 Tax=Pseudomonas sp. HR96 TaxID=1027966 RepID=UPI002A75C26F|nr:OsmC family protein [Pseudomonas sp. HR96]WPO98593.1 OsmC family protein [Pseudomonas sp. HR96]